jgi:hypothetical protein
MKAPIRNDPFLPRGAWPLKRYRILVHRWASSKNCGAEYITAACRLLFRVAGGLSAGAPRRFAAFAICLWKRSPPSAHSPFAALLIAWTNSSSRFVRNRAPATELPSRCVLAGQRLGIKEVEDGIWLVSFMSYDPGYIDLEQKTLQTIDNPFGTSLSPMS